MEIRPELTTYLGELDAFIESTLMPLQEKHPQYFDHRREFARTDWDNNGQPQEAWEALLHEAKDLSNQAGHFAYALPSEFGGKDGSNFDMAVIREHLAAKGLGLHCDLQNEHSMVGNFPTVLLLRDFGSEAQKQALIPGHLNGTAYLVFGLTEPKHGSDATWMETTAVPQQRDGVDGWLINGEKMWTSGVNTASHVLIFARTSGEQGRARGISSFIMPMGTAGFQVEEWLWTLNMPTDHPRITLKDVWLPAAAILGEKDKGLALAQHFVHENRIRQAASSLGTARYCIEQTVAYLNERHTFGQPLSNNQSLQFRMAELQTDYELIKALTFQTAAQIDTMSKAEVAKNISDVVAMCNYRANQLACKAADEAIQLHGGMGYSRHKQFEHHYRHHRRYRITEGSDEIQLRKIAGVLFGKIQ